MSILLAMLGLLISFQAGAAATTCALVPLPMTSAGHEGGKSYIVQVKSGVLPDDTANPTRSVLRLFEDGDELGPAHTSHARIRNLGVGRYSHWVRQDRHGENIRFAASDNSDPRKNGKKYSYCVGPGPVVGPIADVKAPTIPVMVSVVPASVALTWTASTDDVKVTDYQVYRNDKLVSTVAATTTVPSYIDEVKEVGAYKYQVLARDAAGNASEKSDGLSIEVSAVKPVLVPVPEVPAKED